MRTLPGSLLVLALLPVLACGDGSGDGSSGPAELDGIYEGNANATINGTPVVIQVTVNSEQSGSDVSGTWDAEGVIGGTFTGTIAGSTVTFTMTQTFDCPGTYSGSATISSDYDRLTGSYGGSDCSTTSSATFVLNRN